MVMADLSPHCAPVSPTLPDSEMLFNTLTDRAYAAHWPVRAGGISVYHNMIFLGTAYDKCHVSINWGFFHVLYISGSEPFCDFCGLLLFSSLFVHLFDLNML